MNGIVGMSGLLRRARAGIDVLVHGDIRAAGHRGADGAEVIDALERIPYDLVLMDCRMPDVDGFEATRRIRDARASYRDIPIVAMTANAMNGDRARCLAARMDPAVAMGRDYVSRPVSIDELASTIRKWAGRHSQADTRRRVTIARL